MWRSILFSALFSMLCILLTTSRRHASERQRCAAWVECRLVRRRAFQRPRIAPTTRAAAAAGDGGSHRRALLVPSKGSGEGGSYTGAFPGFPSVSADFHQPPLRALSIPGAWVLRSPDLVVVSSFRMHCTFPIWKYRWCDAFNFDPRVLGIQPCHPSGSKPAAHFFPNRGSNP